MNILMTIFNIVWLCSALALLFAIWRTSLEHSRRVEKTLIDATMKSAEAAHTAALAAQSLAQLLTQQERRSDEP